MSKGMMIDIETYSRIKEMMMQMPYIAEEEPFTCHEEKTHDDRYYAYVRHWREWKNEEMRDLWVERLSQ